MSLLLLLMMMMMMMMMMLTMLMMFCSCKRPTLVCDVITLHRESKKTRRQTLVRIYDMDMDKRLVPPF